MTGLAPVQQRFVRREVFGGGAVGLDPDVVSDAARQIAEAVATGVQVAVVGPRRISALRLATLKGQPSGV